MLNSRIQLSLWLQHRLFLQRNINLQLTTIIQGKIFRFKTLTLVFIIKKMRPIWFHVPMFKKAAHNIPDIDNQLFPAPFFHLKSCFELNFWYSKPSSPYVLSSQKVAQNYWKYHIKLLNFNFKTFFKTPKIGQNTKGIPRGKSQI